jgi:ATP-binding cassette, subfamily B, bacterial
VYHEYTPSFMKKTIFYGLKAFQLSWQANRAYAIIVPLGKVYENTLYPFIQILLLTKAIDIFTQNKGVTFSDLTWIILAYITATILRIFLKNLLDVKEAFLQVKMEAYIDVQISKKLTELDPATFEDPEFQNLLAQIDGVKGTIQTNLDRFIGVFDAIVKCITAAVVVSFLFPLFAPIIIIATLPSYLALSRMRTAVWPYFVEKRSLLTRVTIYIKELLSSDSTSKEAIIFQTGPTLLNKIKKEQSTYFTGFDKANEPWLLNTFFVRVLQFCAFLYTQYLTFSQVMAGTVSIGQFTLIFHQTLTLAFSAEECLNLYASMAARTKYVDKYFEFLAIQKKVSSPATPLSIPIQPITPIIEFRNVSFRYPKTDRYILKNFNLTIQSGQKVALVGENGAGKTTIIKLLLRFYDVTDGEILLNGINIKDVSLDEWHKYIGALFQDFIKYQFTFKENVYFGNTTKTNDEKLLKNAIQKSGADTYLQSLPKNINQVLGKMFEDGIDLSGGQWQKLALARAFFRNAPILVLDEPTSAIDAKAEYEIFENVQKLQNDKTVIIISHRFSTVRNADRILVLDEGNIIEEGNHAKLMKKNGLYAELFNIQAQGYK